MTTMKLESVEFDEDENPSRFTVSISLDEMALLYRLAGHTAPKRVTQVSGDVRWGNALYDLADGAGSALNRFYADGANDVIPRFGIQELVAPSTTTNEGTEQ